MRRVECPSCGKINSGDRSRCMYCEAPLAGASTPGGSVPDYLKGSRRRFPWGLVFLLLLAAAAYAAWRLKLLARFGL